MGIYRHTYLGPYAEVKSKLIDITVDRCKKPDSCPNPKKGFCPECGINVCSNRYEKLHDVEEAENNHELFENGEMFHTSIMGPNKIEWEAIGAATRGRRDGVRFRRIWWYPGDTRDGEFSRPYSFDDDYEDKALEFSVDSKVELEWFVAAYAKEIEKLRKTYSNVEVKWGMLRWCS